MAAPAAEKLLPLNSPIHTELYPLLTTVLLVLGALTSASFCLYQVSRTRHSRVLAQEVLLAGVSAVLLGLGSFFLLLWTGVFL